MVISSANGVEQQEHWEITMARALVQVEMPEKGKIMGDSFLEEEEEEKEIPSEIIVNIIDGLREVGWTDKQIVDFQLFICSGDKRYLENIKNG